MGRGCAGTGTVVTRLRQKNTGAGITRLPYYVSECAATKHGTAVVTNDGSAVVAAAAGTVGTRLRHKDAAAEGLECAAKKVPKTVAAGTVASTACDAAEATTADPPGQCGPAGTIDRTPGQERHTGTPG